MIENTSYILLTKNIDGCIEYLAASKNKKDLFLIMKIHMYFIEHDNMYSFEYIKKNLDFFEYISDLLPSEVADLLQNYEYNSLEYAL